MAKFSPINFLKIVGRRTFLGVEELKSGTINRVGR